MKSVYTGTQMIMDTKQIVQGNKVFIYFLFLTLLFYDIV